MAHTFGFLRVENGTETRISFTNFSYTPQHPKQTVETSSGSEDGNEISSNTYQNVQETASVLLGDVSVDALLTQLKQVGTWFTEAKERQKYRAGPQIYVEFKPSGSTGSTYRSEILYGAYNLEDEVLDYQILANRGEIQLQWERRHYWEGAEEWLNIQNANGTGAGGSFVRVNNYGAGTGSAPNVDVAYVTVASADIKGSLPAQCRVEFRNPNAAALAIVQIHSASFGSGYTTHYAGANVALTDGVETTVVDVAIPTATVKAMSGMFYNILLGMVTPTLGAGQSLWLKGELYLDSGVLTRPLQTTGWISKSYLDSDPNGLTELGQVQIPPRISNAGEFATLTAMKLRIKAKLVGTPGFTINLRRVMILPVESNRRLTSVSFYLPLNGVLYDDGIYRRLYIIDSVGTAPVFIGKGRPLTITPGRLNTIFFSYVDTSGNFSSSAHAADVRIAYRPRTAVI